MDIGQGWILKSSLVWKNKEKERKKEREGERDRKDVTKLKVGSATQKLLTEIMGKKLGKSNRETVKLKIL